jgi:hypothetical protein
VSAWKRIGIVVVGYGIAVAAGALSGAAYDARVAKLPYDTSGGMYAGGQMLASLGVFALVHWLVRRPPF